MKTAKFKEILMSNESYEILHWDEDGVPCNPVGLEYDKESNIAIIGFGVYGIPIDLRKEIEKVPDNAKLLVCYSSLLLEEPEEWENAMNGIRVRVIPHYEEIRIYI